MAAESQDGMDGIFHYTFKGEVPTEIQKYWAQRYKIFSQYDEGIWMTDDAWFGITPESVANKIAAHIASSAGPEKDTLIDAFCGAGGNTIAFALSGRWKLIFAIEKDPKILKCAKHNAEIYGVARKIVWIQGDCFDVIQRYEPVAKQAVIFGSPPWGGPEYNAADIFNLDAMLPYSLKQIHKSFSAITPDMALYLPRSSNLNQIARHAKPAKQVNGDATKDPDDHKTQVVHYCLGGASKALTVYYGAFASIIEESDTAADEEEAEYYEDQQYEEEYPYDERYEYGYEQS
ncbi:RNA methylase [Aulographum hederae CBS 113979]|uniref:Trimethylguanosine synthase n=1 Tax=Aulographum hederae CBS 113979 TaxID=1176131 RepID=A0A6G1H5I0_9PEZI|nr:RNA methylase [Aulographum hederae CBS 113979]